MENHHWNETLLITKFESYVPLNQHPAPHNLLKTFFFFKIFDSIISLDKSWLGAIDSDVDLNIEKMFVHIWIISAPEGKLHFVLEVVSYYLKKGKALLSIFINNIAEKKLTSMESLCSLSSLLQGRRENKNYTETQNYCTLKTMPIVVWRAMCRRTIASCRTLPTDSLLHY